MPIYVGDSGRLRDMGRCYNIDFYKFIPDANSADSSSEAPQEHTYGSSLTADLFERLRVSRLAEIDRQFKNDLQQIDLRREKDRSLGRCTRR